MPLTGLFLPLLNILVSDVSEVLGGKPGGGGHGELEKRVQSAQHPHGGIRGKRSEPAAPLSVLAPYLNTLL